MHGTIQALIEGKPIHEKYQLALAHWKEVLNDANRTDPDALARLVGVQQQWFEMNCGYRDMGQEIMVVTGICQYYDRGAGFGDNLAAARAMYQGFQRSDCSSEVKFMADDIAHLHEELVED